MTGKPVVGVAEFDSMTPQERADSVRASVVLSWDEVDPELRARIEARAPEVEQRRKRDD